MGSSLIDILGPMVKLLDDGDHLRWDSLLFHGSVDMSTMDPVESFGKIQGQADPTCTEATASTRLLLKPGALRVNEEVCNSLKVRVRSKKSVCRTPILSISKLREKLHNGLEAFEQMMPQAAGEGFAGRAGEPDGTQRSHVPCRFVGLGYPDHVTVLPVLVEMACTPRLQVSSKCLSQDLAHLGRALPPHCCGRDVSWHGLGQSKPESKLVKFSLQFLVSNVDRLQERTYWVIVRFCSKGFIAICCDVLQLLLAG